MAFFKSFQQNLPSVNITSLLDSVSSRVDDLASAVSDVTYTVSDQLSEQVSTMISKVQDEEEENGDEGAGGGGEAGSRKARSAADRRGSKANRQGEAGSSCDGGDGENAAGAGQLEWEWRDGCWRVKRTEAELAEEERKKAEQQVWQEEKERKRRERRARQQEKEAESRSLRDTVEGEEEDEESPEEPGRSALKAGEVDVRKANKSTEETPETGGLTKKEEEEEEEEEEQDRTNQGQVGEEGEDEEEEEELPAPTKKKKSLKKKAKDSSEKPKKSSEKEQKKEKKSKKKKKKKAGKGAASDSEEDRDPEAQIPQKPVSAWDNKQSADQEGYSSEASSGQAGRIQRIKRESPLNELQPPPYQNTPEHRSHSGLRAHSGRGGGGRGGGGGGGGGGSSPERCSSEASVDQDTESYLNKGYEEDVPSDSTAVLGPEDGSGSRLPALYEPEPLAKYGTLDVAFEYDAGQQWLAVTVTAATDIPAPRQAGNVAWQVHLVLLPTKKQRAKTGVQRGPCPVFTETFKFSRLTQEALVDHAVRFRLYSVQRMKKERVLGEKVFYLTKLNLQGKMALPVTLEPGSELTGCGSLVSVSRSTGALSYRSTGESCAPEILLGLVYNAATGRLSAEVIQGSHFKTAVSDKPTDGLFCCIKHVVGGELYVMRDTYVKLTMLDSKGKEMSKCKTGVCRGQPNPTYKESFVFQVALFQLSEVSLVVSVFCRRSSMRPREPLGWVSLGLNSTGEEQQTHWSQMKEAEGQQVCHWHVLTDT